MLWFCGVFLFVWWFVFFFTSAIPVVDKFLMYSNEVKCHVSTESCDDCTHSIFKTPPSLFLPHNKNKRNSYVKTKLMILLHHILQIMLRNCNIFCLIS